jgi:hypothetical protein
MGIRRSWLHRIACGWPNLQTKCFWSATRDKNLLQLRIPQAGSYADAGNGRGGAWFPPPTLGPYQTANCTHEANIDERWFSHFVCTARSFFLFLNATGSCKRPRVQQTVDAGQKNVNRIL